MFILLKNATHIVCSLIPHIVRKMATIMLNYFRHIVNDEEKKNSYNVCKSELCKVIKARTL